MPETGYKYRDALRLLFVIALGAEPLAEVDPATGATTVFIGEKRLMAVDFWIRYPDHFAEKLLDEYEATGDASLLAETEKIFEREEPSLRLVKMLRWKRGAYDHIEDALSVLSSKNLIFPRESRQTNGSGRFDYLVAAEAHTFLEKCVEEEPAFGWYAERTNLVMEVAGLRSGTKLKDSQYKVDEYRDTPQGAYIPSIAERVRQRLQRLQASRS